MLKRYIPFILLLAFLGCSKTRYETKPAIKIKSISSSEIHPNQELDVILEYSDKEGDIGTGELTYVRDRTNLLPIPDPGSNDIIDTVRYPIPTFPKTISGDIEVKIPYSYMRETLNDNDTMIFRFTVKDVAGNQSDTIFTGKIIAFQN